MHCWCFMISMKQLFSACMISNGNLDVHIAWKIIRKNFLFVNIKIPQRSNESLQVVYLQKRHIKRLLSTFFRISHRSPIDAARREPCKTKVEKNFIWEIPEWNGYPNSLIEVHRWNLLLNDSVLLGPRILHFLMCNSNVTICTLIYDRRLCVLHTIFPVLIKGTEVQNKESSAVEKPAFHVPSHIICLYDDTYSRGISAYIPKGLRKPMTQNADVYYTDRNPVKNGTRNWSNLLV